VPRTYRNTALGGPSSIRASTRMVVGPRGAMYFCMRYLPEPPERLRKPESKIEQHSVLFGAKICTVSTEPDFFEDPWGPPPGPPGRTLHGPLRTPPGLGHYANFRSHGGEYLHSEPNPGGSGRSMWGPSGGGRAESPKGPPKQHSFRVYRANSSSVYWIAAPRMYFCENPHVHSTAPTHRPVPGNQMPAKKSAFGSISLSHWARFRSALVGVSPGRACAC
jgi:hypothetical protein